MTPAIDRGRLSRGVRWLETKPTADSLWANGSPLDIEEFGELFAAANDPLWVDTSYRSHLPDDRTPETIARADLPTVRALLTEFLRGERFCDGYWIAEICSGRALLIFARALELVDEGGDEFGNGRAER